MSADIAVSILIPAWDEEGAIGSVTAGALASCRGAGLVAECVVCVDARTVDRTAGIVGAAGARAITQQSRGLTAAVLEAADSAGASTCVVLDGDGQHDGAYVERLALPVLAGDADLVIGVRDFRLLRGSFGGGLRGTLRRVGARSLRFAATVALGGAVPDPLSGMFACRRSDLLRLRQVARVAPPGGYKVGLGLLAMTPPGRVAHVTVPFGPRHGGASKLDVGVALTTLRQLLGVMMARPPATSTRIERTGKSSRKPLL